MTYKTNQEEFWAGEFGDRYINRNMDKELLASNLALFAEVLKLTGKVESVMEFGPNIGMNLKAIELLLPDANLNAIEINKKAVDKLKKDMPRVKVKNHSVLDLYNNESKFPLVLCKGLLIHINPEHLETVYDNIYNCTNRYICIAEYYNPAPVKVNYREHADKLFKRDFAGEMLSKYSDLQLIDYRFHYRNDRIFPQDDITWFLLKKDSK